MNKLDRLLQQRPGQDIWRGGRGQTRQTATVSSGHAALDAALAGGGWPRGALYELLTETSAPGIITLLAPAVAQLARERRWIALISPPSRPCATAFSAHGIDLSRLLLVRPRKAEQQAWALEQALRAGSCSAVLAWSGESFSRTQLRRLQLAARDGDCQGFLIRPARHAARPSPAALRLMLQPRANGLRIEILKQQGGWPVEGFILPWPTRH